MNSWSKYRLENGRWANTETTSLFGKVLHIRRDLKPEVCYFDPIRILFIRIFRIRVNRKVCEVFAYAIFVRFKRKICDALRNIG